LIKAHLADPELRGGSSGAVSAVKHSLRSDVWKLDVGAGFIGAVLEADYLLSWIQISKI
jgi:hypothetical protein